MATTMIDLPKGVWTLVSEISVDFQIPEQSGAFGVEASAPPTTTNIRKKITPGKIYRFTKIDGNLYMISVDANIQVALDPIA